MSEKKNCGCLDGVCCDVNSCVYHDCDINKCTASSIKVEGMSSLSRGDTCCSTYKSK